MSTNSVIQGYFEALKNGKDWQSYLDDRMSFTSFVAPVKQASGKKAYLDSTRKFFLSIGAVEVREMILEGQKACVLTRYEVRLPTGNTFNCDVAEIFKVAGDKITSLDIYFDSTPFPK